MKFWMPFIRRVRLAVRFLYYGAVKLLSYLIFPRRRYRDVWLFSERGVDACDNAWVLFCYVRETEPHRRVYYILERGALCREQVERTGKILRRGSFRHLLLYFLPTVKISTHIFGVSPDPALLASKIGRRHLRAAGKTVFLQHGITKNDIPSLYAQRTEVLLFVCGAQPEYDFVRSRFGYMPDAVRYLGFPRFDLLMAARPARQILFFPTWRFSLAGMSAADFRRSAYARTVMAVLTDARLNALLAAHGVRLVFASHHEMRGFFKNFHMDGAQVVMGGADVGVLIRASAALITDESSVAFDFAYAGRPVIYAVMDGFDAPNYPDGWFDREKDGFGEVVRDMAALFTAVERILTCDFRMEEKFARRAERVFPLRDGENRRRCHEAILTLAGRADL